MLGAPSGQGMAASRLQADAWWGLLPLDRRATFRGPLADSSTSTGQEVSLELHALAGGGCLCTASVVGRSRIPGHPSHFHAHGRCANIAPGRPATAPSCTSSTGVESGRLLLLLCLLPFTHLRSYQGYPEDRPASSTSMKPPNPRPRSSLGPFFRPLNHQESGAITGLM